MVKLRIIRQWYDHAPVVLGQVELHKLPAKYQNVHDLMDALWDAFCDTHPDSDSQFIDYLVDEQEIAKFTPVEDDFQNIVFWHEPTTPNSRDTQ